MTTAHFFDSESFHSLASDTLDRRKTRMTIHVHWSLLVFHLLAKKVLSMIELDEIQEEGDEHSTVITVLV